MRGIKMNNRNIKFGIIIPFYGVEKYIDKCLKSVEQQTYNNFEAILVDDGSIDNSRAIAEKYVQKDPSRFRIITQKNQGVGAARNAGIRFLSQDIDYIIFLDSDDFVDVTLLEKLNEVVSSQEYDIITYNYSEQDENGHVFGIYNLCHDKTGTASREELKQNACFTICLQGRVYNKKFWDKLNISFPTNCWYEDAAISSYIMSNCSSMYYLNETLLYYVQRDGSIMNSKNCFDKMMTVTTSLDYLRKCYAEHENLEEFKDELEASSVTTILVTENRLNMMEKGDALQKKLSSYLFEHFPDCIENKYNNDVKRDKLLLLKHEEFGKYYLKYSLFPQVRSFVKTLVPVSVTSMYRNLKYR